MSDNFQEPKLFEKGILYQLTKYREANTHYVVIFYGIIGIALLLYGYTHYVFAWWHFLLFPVLGIIGWTLTEYVLHRFFFHYEARSEKLKKFIRFLHIAHHEKPRDLTYVTGAPLATFPIAVVIFGLTFLFIGKFAFLFIPGFVVGYSIYEYIHHAVHKYPHPPKPFRKLWKHHLEHHYKCPDKKFGVSNRFWDKIFGT